MSTDPVRGTIVAGANDAGEPYTAIVTRCQIGAAPNGEDLWTLIDHYGDTIDVIASCVVVIDDDRIEDLRQALENA